MSDTQNQNNIHLDVYSLQDDWMNNIASNHFQLENENLLRTGLVGYVNEVMANSIEDTNFMTNVYYNEVIPIRANLPDSIYAYASQVKYEGFLAKAAKQKFILAIKKSDVVDNAIEFKNTDGQILGKKFLIGKNSYLEIEREYKFFLEYDIEIEVKKNLNTTDVYLTSKYIINKSNDIYRYIPSTISNLNREEYLFLNLYGNELTYESKTFTVYQNDIINTTSFELQYSGQLSHFDVYYKENPFKSERILLNKYFLDELEPGSDPFCFYRFLDDETLEIFFSPYNGYFRPEFNSQIIVEYYTTTGSKGNIHYTGTDSVFVVSNEEYKNKNINFVTYLSEPSIGGEDISDLSKIKKKVIDQFSIRNNIITESDLNKFFNDNDKESEVLFIKRRDDIFKRIFSAFILAKDEKNNILPTNTVKLRIHETDMDIYNENLGIYIFKNRKIIHGGDDTYLPFESEIKAGRETNNFVYANPTLMKVNMSPLALTHYNIYVNEYNTLQFNFSNSESMRDFIVNDVNVFRDPVMSDRYEISLELATNSNVNDILSKTDDGKYVDKGIVKVKALISTTNNIGYIDFSPSALNHNNNKIVYKAIMKTTDYIDNGDRMEIRDSLRQLDNGGESKLISYSYIPDTGFSMEICVYYKNGTYNKYGRLEKLNELKDFCLANSFKTEQNMILFTNLDRMMNTNVKIEENNGALNFICDSVPVVSYDYYARNESTKIFSILKFFSSYLRDNLNKLENNFDIDIKFFNTFGVSKWFTIGLEKNNLDSVNIKVKFRIKTNINLDNTQRDNVKNFIKNYIESINENKLRSIFVSNLIRMIENEFHYVLYVEFLGFNDYDTSVQALESKITSINDIKNRDEVISYVPEYLNLNKLQNNNGDFEPEIYIEFV